MLVDLGRNDIGKISVIGSVQVEKYMSVERYSHVMHIGSTVSGQIAEGRDALDAVDAILPAGTRPELPSCGPARSSGIGIDTSGERYCEEFSGRGYGLIIGRTGRGEYDDRRGNH